MILQGLAFYLFTVVAIFSAAMVITARSPVHSVLWLILTFFNAAGLFILLGAEFLAMLLVVVYVGAVAVLFLFVVMMLDLNTLRLREGMAEYMPVGVAIGAILLAEIVAVMGGWALSPDVQSVREAPIPPLSEVHNTAALGNLIYTDYIYLFQAAGLVLLVAMIGSIMLTHRVRPGVRKQNITRQLDRGRTVELKKVPTRGGI
ncbi:NADH-quinone oxidoreductase subunit J [Haematospirillum jordaniae]|uniref:NADH-quinone oxidoreductase subunit J n=1 Tax=Haematospirillum jordaniae TaxID=1549855 RepID=A0A143DEP8_9PROT|nr:NADH-quinone oxidoreductase subunit J [Haematospirillum jordaniae]AMW35242.1 NADH:ubiquinone oxidoreductase subunit J [Haematospirillum jordaniae]NKD45602.1 NADH-quinone oxidoreductase subunit J [Haematospirillum jordaniae]NKD56355.1 NADH-quinone oxidoreductase subunit J [Haematospirillum jordaniae]NKD58413.1 NADH-quinone oxidoreductase subunit J [Haematospirillum jordaniae]NKD66418.1 NADH-quinone oxidoreductase subunit J [Haematospirillum jordaniae]